MVDERFAKTEFLVEAVGCEYMYLWRDNDEGRSGKLPWVCDSMGLHIEVGKFHEHPVCISVRWATINGHLICFWEAVSRVVDIRLIASWFDENCDPRYDMGTRQARTNAMNFHNVLWYCRNNEI